MHIKHLVPGHFHSLFHRWLSKKGPRLKRKAKQLIIELRMCPFYDIFILVKIEIWALFMAAEIFAPAAFILSIDFGSKS